MIVLITDAYDENSRSSLDEAIAAVKAAGITVYTVGIGGVAGISMKGHDELKTLAAATGGRVVLPRPARRTAAGLRPARVGRADALPDHLHADEPEARRHVADHLAADRTPRTSSSRRGPATSRRSRRRSGRPSSSPRWTSQNQYLQVSADDLVVLEDGVEQKIDTFQEATTPVSLVLALDASGSMKKSADKVVEAARAFVGDRAAGGQARRRRLRRPVRRRARPDAGPQGGAARRSTNTDAMGGTALYDALCDSFSLVKQAPGRRAVVVLTDGRDENNPGTAPGSTRTYEDVTQALQRERRDGVRGRASARRSTRSA